VAVALIVTNLSAVMSPSAGAVTATDGARLETVTVRGADVAALSFVSVATAVIEVDPFYFLRVI